MKRRMIRKLFILATIFVGTTVAILFQGTLASAVLLAAMLCLIVFMLYQTLAKLGVRILQYEPMLTEMINRQRRETRTLANIAGSVGKMAPRVRAIESDIGGLTVPRGGTTRPAIKVEVAPRDQYPTYASRSWTPVRPELNVLTILDDFSERAFEPEWNQFPITPTNWAETLNERDIDLLFVESAWNGNQGAWLYHLVGTSAPRQAIVDLVFECKKREIPTIFWNKEDPPHFEDFLATAKLFDHVFTSDVDKIPAYKQALGHDRVQTLAFGAQPLLHNPAQVSNLKRDKTVAFGGMYFRHKYPERSAQMDYMLPVAAKHGLEIFSRHQDKNEDYQFPEPLQRHISGSLSYGEMLTAYHRFKVFLNFNSVIGSRSMCARRIFEITASGAAVVTPPSPAIDAFFPASEITVAPDGATTSLALKTLLGSDGLRDRRVHVAQRRIWENHTYSHRVGEVLKSVGHKSELQRPTVSVVLPTMRPENIPLVVENLSRQEEPVELILGTHGFALEETARKSLLEAVDSLKVVEVAKNQSLGSMLNVLIQHANGNLVSKMDDDDFYGANYLRDLVNAKAYSRADVVGKASVYFYFEASDHTTLSYGAHEHRYTNFVRGATLTASRDLFSELKFRDLGKSEDSDFLQRVEAQGGSIYASDRFNFYVNRRSDESLHTWNVSDAELLAGAAYQFTGRPDRHVSI